jgi:hypothetical protein
MTSARLLAVALLFCPLLIFGQEKQQPAANDPSPAVPADSSSYRALSGEQKAELTLRALQRLQAGHHYDPNTEHPWITVSRDGNILGWGVDENCYTIRSYVVERDAKDSDATHLVRSSTCQRASHYQVKNADAQSDSDHK